MVTCRAEIEDLKDDGPPLIGQLRPAHGTMACDGVMTCASVAGKRSDARLAFERGRGFVETLLESFSTPSFISILV